VPSVRLKRPAAKDSTGAARTQMPPGRGLYKATGLELRCRCEDGADLSELDLAKLAEIE